MTISLKKTYDLKKKKKNVKDDYIIKKEEKITIQKMNHT